MNFIQNYRNPYYKYQATEKPSQLEVMCGVMYAPKNSVNGW